MIQARGGRPALSPEGCRVGPGAYTGFMPPDEGSHSELTRRRPIMRHRKKEADMVTYEASLRRRRETVYHATRRCSPFEGIARDLLQSLVLLLLLATILAVRIYFTAPY